MAVILLVTLSICIASALSLNSPAWYLGSYTENPVRWPYGGCVEVSKIYPAPGSHLPPSLNKYAEDWNLTITVVFSRPVTRILWKFTNRTRLRLTPQNIQLNRTCTRNACLFLKLGKMYVMYMPATSGPTQRGNLFSDEFEFTFKVPAYAKDHVSEFYFALDGGWMYSPVYKFMSYPHVEYVPYVTVRYLSPNNDSASSRPPERDTNYWVNYPSTCAARSGLIYRPFIFNRAMTKIKQQAPTAGSPKLLTELSEVVSVSSKEKRKLRLYYQMKQRGDHIIRFPDSIKALDKGTNLKISISAPSIKALIFTYTTPNLYIPVKTEYTFDYHERAYYEGLKWNAYFFTNKKNFPGACRDPNRKFDCNSFVYSSVFPNPSHHHQIFAKSHSDGYRTAAEARQAVNTSGLNIKHFHSSTIWKRSRLVSDHIYCLRYHTKSDYCQRTVDNLVLDPYWKMIVIFLKNINEILDSFMMCNELKDILYESERNLFGDGYVGMMRYSATGSAYEKDMSNVIPLLNFKNRFNQYLGAYRRKLLTDMCHFDVKRNVGKWGRLRTFIERGNMYRIHYSKSSTSWTIQQNLYVGYYKKNGQRGYLNATIVSFPEHIKKAVERYAVLTNVQAAQFTGDHKDTRLRSARESYPLEKAVFVPRKLAYVRGCGTLRIFKGDISGIQAEYHQRYGKNYYEQLCDKSPDDCTGLPFDSLDKFPLIPPFNVLDLNGPINPRWEFRRRAIYYRDNTVNDLFILNSPNSYYTGVVEISGVEVKDPEFVEKSCNDFWKFTPDRYEITKGHLIGTVTNKGEGGSNVVVSVQCTPKLGVLPEQATVWVGPHQTETVKFKLGGYLTDTIEEETAGYKCEMSITVDVTLFTSVVGKNFPICKILIPTFGGSFVDPCGTYLDHDIMYYNLPKEFAHEFSLNAFLTSAVGREYELLKLISIKLVKYHMIRLSCDNDDVLALTEDQLFISSLSNNLVSRDIDLIHSIDKLLQRRIYIFIKKQQSSKDDIETKCLITLIASPYATCAISSRKYIVLTKADVPAAVALEEEEAARKTVKIEQTIWNKWISEKEEVIAAVLVCTITSLVLIVLVVTGNSGLFIYSKLSSSEREIEQIREELQTRKREHKKTWNNPQMYLVKGVLGPHYVLYNFKATDALDTGNLKVVKIAGTLKYKEKTLQVIFGHVKKVIVKKTQQGKAPNQVWIQASSGMYLLKQKYVSKEYEEEFDSLLQRHANKDTRTTTS